MFRIRISVESTMSPRYGLFYTRWILIALQIVSCVEDIIAATRVDWWGQTKTVYEVMAGFAIASLLISLWDISIHKKGTSTPKSPVSIVQQSLDQQSMDATSSADRKVSRGISINAGDEVISVPDEDERLPFIAPQAEQGSEKSDDDNEPDKTYFCPSKVVTVMDAAFSAAFIALYFVVMALETERLTAIQIFAITGTMLAALIHVYCFGKEAKALYKQRHKNRLFAFRRGAVRI